LKAKIDNVEIVECTPEELVKMMQLLGKVDKTVVVKYEYPSTGTPYWQYPWTITSGTGYISVDANGNVTASGVTFS